MPQSTEKQILTRIQRKGPGWAFCQGDFADLGTRKAIDMALIRLTNKSKIRRVMHGTYDYPRFSELLQKEMGPDIDQVAQALARKFGWRIQPSGPATLNLIGLSTQVPSRYVYKTDGPNRKYGVGKTSLEFVHHALKETGFKNKESAMIVQALKALGREHVTADTIRDIRQWLPASRRSAVLKDTQRVTSWVYSAIKRICREAPPG